MVGPRPACNLGECGVTHIGVDDRDRRAGESAEREPEVDDHRGHGDLVVAGHESDHAQPVTADLARDPRTRGFELAEHRAIELDPDRGEQVVVYALIHCRELATWLAGAVAVIRALHRPRAVVVRGWRARACRTGSSDRPARAWP